MLRRIRKWAWIVPVVAVLMVGEAFLLRRHYTSRIEQLLREVKPSSVLSVRDSHDSIPVVAREAFDPKTVWRAPTPNQSSTADSLHVVDSLLLAADSAELVVMPTFERDVEDVIDSLQMALDAQERVIVNLMSQLNRPNRQRADSLRMARRRSVGSGRMQGDVAVGFQAGKRVLDQRIRAEGIDRHLDTLSRWIYHMPELQERIVGVNSAIYEYVESIRMTYSDSVVSQIREELLDYWKGWNDRTAEKIRRVKQEDRNER